MKMKKRKKLVYNRMKHNNELRWAYDKIDTLFVKLIEFLEKGQSDLHTEDVS